MNLSYLALIFANLLVCIIVVDVDSLFEDGFCGILFIARLYTFVSLELEKSFHLLLTFCYLCK